MVLILFPAVVYDTQKKSKGQSTFQEVLPKLGFLYSEEVPQMVLLFVQHTTNIGKVNRFQRHNCYRFCASRKFCQWSRWHWKSLKRCRKRYLQLKGWCMHSACCYFTAHLPCNSPGTGNLERTARNWWYVWWVPWQMMTTNTVFSLCSFFGNHNHSIFFHCKISSL